MQLSLTNSWTTHEDSDLSRENVIDLLENRIPTIRIQQFLSKDECSRLEEALSNSDFGAYEQLDPPILKLGPSQYESSEAGPGGKTHYFTKVSEAISVRDKICEAAKIDPIRRLLHIFNNKLHLNADVAVEDGWGDYFSGTIRQIDNSAKLHADFGPLTGSGWGIGDVDTQLAINIFISEPTDGGYTTVYNRPWSETDEESGKVENCYSYKRRLVEGAEYKVIRPIAGDAVLFNSRNYHEVEVSCGSRLTASTFMGRLPNEQLITWS